MSVATLTVKGQITIPVAIRAELGLDAGAKVEFERRPDGYLMRPSSNPVTRLKGFFGPFQGTSATIADMDAAVGRAVGDDDARIKGGR
jgi:AbrB family looped-hinge helix DNA binding protein